MTPAIFSKDSKEFQMFGDYWNLCKKYWNIKQSDSDEWEQFVYDVQEFCEKYECVSLARKIALALLNDLEERCKEHDT